MANFTPTAEQIAEAQASGGTKEIFVSAAGVEVRDVPTTTVDRRIEARAQEIAKAEIGEVKLNRAQRRLAKLRGDFAEFVRRIDIPDDDEPWFVKRGDFAELNIVAQLSGRDKFGVLMLDTADEFNGFIAAVLSQLLVESETDLTLFFNDYEEAFEFASDAAPGVADVVAMLFYGAVDLNPEVWPENSEAAKKVWTEMKNAALQSNSSTSNTSASIES